MSKANPEIVKQLQRCKKRFEKLDTASKGQLGQNDISNIVKYIFSVYHPTGVPLTQDVKKSLDITLSDLFKDEDDKIEFSDFTKWFIETCNGILNNQIPLKNEQGVTDADNKKASSVQAEQDKDQDKQESVVASEQLEKADKDMEMQEIVLIEGSSDLNKMTPIRMMLDKHNIKYKFTSTTLATQKEYSYTKVIVNGKKYDGASALHYFGQQLNIYDTQDNQEVTRINLLIEKYDQI